MKIVITGSIMMMMEMMFVAVMMNITTPGVIVVPAILNMMHVRQGV